MSSNSSLTALLSASAALNKLVDSSKDLPDSVSVLEFPERKKFVAKGKYRVAMGDLAAAGVPGRVYAPVAGKKLPLVVFAHDWAASPKDYHRLLQLIASWGFVVAAPEAEAGVLPNHGAFARDIAAVARALPKVPIAESKVTIDPADITLMGVGMGASCAIMAAAVAPARQVVAAFPQATHPSASKAASQVRMPILLIDDPSADVLSASDAAEIAKAAPGRVEWTTVGTAQAGSLIEGFGLRRLLFGASGSSKDIKGFRGLLVAAAKRQL